MNALRLILSALIWVGLCVAPASVWAAETAYVDTGKVNARLISSHDVVAPDETFALALETKLDEGWHTYWRNPGDSGEPVYIKLTLPDGTVESETYWPVPMPVATGPIINYGFEGTPIFPIELSFPEDVTGPVEIVADVYYLVCKDICIPEDAQLSLTMQIGESVADPYNGPDIAAAMAVSPVVGDLSGGASVEDGQLITKINGLADKANAYVFPLTNVIVDHSAPQSVAVHETGLAVRQTAGFGWQDGTPEPYQVLVAYDGANGARVGEIVNVTPGAEIAIGAAQGAGPAGVVAGPSMTLWVAVFGALIGGMILNLMPCVFPIISLKALSLTKAAHAERSAARREGWAYTVGVLATFVLMAVTIIGLKAAGSTLGWGFQMQNPVVVGVLALLTFAVGLNLLGFFEIGGRLQNVGQGLTSIDAAGSKGALRGAFFTGVLAVIVATPCTAPFMAGALGYALAQPALSTLIVFVALGIGFAAPFLLLAYLPKVLARLPRPGPWMETFRQVLAFPMFATAIWLIWILGNQAGSTGIAIILLAMLMIGFGVWLLRRGSFVGGVIAALAVLGAVMFLRPATDAGTLTGAQADLMTGVWSPAKVAEERAAGRTVFVDFTADWCVTCKVNERLVLKKPDVRHLFAKTDTAFLIADWTNKNDEIAQELARYGRAGIPLYLVYPPSDGSGHDDVSPVILPQILTKSVVESALLEARQHN